MSRKTFTFETFEDIYSGLIESGLYNIGHKEYAVTIGNDTFYKPTRILMLRNNLTSESFQYCILDNHTVVELTDVEIENLLFAYQVFHYSRDKKLIDNEIVLDMTSFDEQEANKLYIELSGHEPNDSYEWLEFPHGISLHEPFNYPDYYRSN